MFTRHAQARMQQRAISNRAVEILMTYGEYRNHRGAEVCYLTTRSRIWMLRDLGKRGFMKLEKMLNAYLVVADDGVVITAGHRLHRLKF